MNTAKNNKKKKQLSFSDIRIQIKFRLINLAVLAVTAILGITMFSMIYSVEKKKELALENTVLSATEQYLEMIIESSVSVAKSIYINSSLYDFLDKQYTSSSDYFDAFYQIQQTSPLILADNNEIISSCTLYTTNSTVMNGSRIQSITQAENEDWYKTFIRLGKPMILYCDPSSGTLSLLRQLDYYTSKNSSLLKLDLSTAPLEQYCQTLDFDGTLYIISGGKLLYSSQLDSKEFSIEQHFSVTTKNYYTVDIEYYADAKQPFHFPLDNWWLLLLTLTAAVFTEVLMRQIAWNLYRRTSKTIETVRREGDFSPLQSENTGKDEIGELIHAGISVSNKLELRTNQHKRTQEILIQKQNAYHQLFGQALLLDAVNSLQMQYPECCADELAEQQTLCAELRLVQNIAQKNGTALSVPDEIPPEIQIPVYSVALTVSALLENSGTLSVDWKDQVLTLQFLHDVRPPQSWGLRISAIFEESDISENYNFRPGYAFNPYLRLKYCFGSNAAVNVTHDGNLTMTLTFSENTSIKKRNEGLP